MFRRNILLLSTIKQLPLLRTAATQSANPSPSQTEDKWDILCGLCLERKPVIARPLNELEIRTMKVFQDIEIDNSMKSIHEVRHESDLRRAEEYAKGKISLEDAEQSVGQTALEYEDLNIKELNEFVPAPRITKADEENDVKSTERCLDKHLLYVIKETIGTGDMWILPHDEVKSSETLRTAAERILQEKCGRMVKAKFMSNLPCGFYKYRYSKEVQQKLNSTGAKIFFMKAQYLEGEVENGNYNWSTRNELPEKLTAVYHNAVNKFLLKDEPVELQ